MSGVTGLYAKKKKVGMQGTLFLLQLSVNISQQVWDLLLSP